MPSPRQKQRLILIAVAGAVLSFALGLILYALSEEIALFKTPTELVEGGGFEGRRIRIGGLVAEGSIVHERDAQVRFAVTDTANSLTVLYKGLLPDLFREGQGVVAEGVFGPDRLFRADTVLAKHDERYMPKEVVEALKAQGVWQHEQK